jgi:glycosyltransferase involved in cell wall biosynthesis
MLLSIVTPTFNQIDYLPDCISSVLGQTDPRYEHIIIDGGSTDGSVDFLEAKRSKLAYFVSESDRGHADALNKGFSRAKGEIMCWLNSDDKFFPWTVEAVLEIFTLFPHIEWISGNPTLWNHKGFSFHTNAGKKNKWDFLIGDYAWLQQESIFWRRSLWEKAGSRINENYQFMVDGELWTRFFNHAEITYTEIILSGFRHHSSNRSISNVDKCVAEMERAVTDMRLRLPRKYYYACILIQVLEDICFYISMGFVARLRAKKVLKHLFYLFGAKPSKYSYLKYDFQRRVYIKS